MDSTPAQISVVFLSNYFGSGQIGFHSRSLSRFGAFPPKLSYWKKASRGLRARKVLPTLSVFLMVRREANWLCRQPDPRRWCPQSSSRAATVSFQNSGEASVGAAAAGDESPEIDLSNFWSSRLQPEHAAPSPRPVCWNHTYSLFSPVFYYIRSGLMWFRSLAIIANPPTCIWITPLERPLHSQKEQDNLSVWCLVKCQKSHRNGIVLTHWLILY